MKITSLPFGVNLAGYMASEKGVGEAVRAAVRSVQAAGIPCALNNFADAGSANLDTSFTGFAATNPYAVNLVHVNADQVPYFAARQGKGYFRRRYNVGYWCWEVGTFPEEWQSSFQSFQEIWVGSRFTQDALSRVAPIPVLRIPLSLQEDLPREDGDRSCFGLPLLPADRFVFLFLFDVQSVLERKNPLGLIRAFRQAFRKDDAATLVLKCSHGESSPSGLAALRDAAGDAVDADIRLLDGVLSREAVNDLLALSDCYVSLHRSEGVGLTLAEAMSLGKPVIATGYSGNMDFMTPLNSFPVDYRLIEIAEGHGPYKKGYVWADPDLDHAASLMRLVYEDRERAAEVGRRARQEIRRSLSPAVVGEAIRDRLQRVSAFAHVAHVERVGDKDRSRRRIREVVRNTVPEGATVAVVSKGDDALLELEGRSGWHFPQAEDGGYAGYYPADSLGAIGHLEALRAKGGAWLLFPATAFWWLEHYDGFARHLDACYPRVWKDEHCILYQIGSAGTDQRRQMDAYLDFVVRSLAAADARGAEERKLTQSIEARVTEMEGAAVSARARAEEMEAVLASSARERAMEREAAQARRAELEAALASARARMEEVAGTVQAQGTHLEQVRRDVAHIGDRFAARPYTSCDLFGTSGDLRQPMGYGPDAPQLGFADLFRGAEDFIAERQRAYLPMVQGLDRVVDLGCGRGEFLRLLAANGGRAVGVELDPALVERGKTQGLDVVQSDALDYLRGVPEGSLDAVFSAQFIEHLDPGRLIELLAVARSRLRAGGTFIAETVNPESYEALKTFHVDLTHQRPIYPQVLLFLCREAGFPSARIFYPLGGGFTQSRYEQVGEYAVVAVA